MHPDSSVLGQKRKPEGVKTPGLLLYFYPALNILIVAYQDAEYLLISVFSFYLEQINSLWQIIDGHADGGACPIGNLSFLQYTASQVSKPDELVGWHIVANRNIDIIFCRVRENL